MVSSVHAGCLRNEDSSDYTSSSGRGLQPRPQLPKLRRGHSLPFHQLRLRAGSRHGLGYDRVARRHFCHSSSRHRHVLRQQSHSPLRPFGLSSRHQNRPSRTHDFVSHFPTSATPNPALPRTAPHVKMPALLCSEAITSLPRIAPRRTILRFPFGLTHQFPSESVSRAFCK